MSNVEMVSFTFCVRNRKIGYKILRACAWAQTQTQAQARPRLECSVFCSAFDDDIGGSCCSSCPSPALLVVALVAAVAATQICPAPVFGHGANFDA